MNIAWLYGNFVEPLVTHLCIIAGTFLVYECDCRVKNEMSTQKCRCQVRIEKNEVEIGHRTHIRHPNINSTLLQQHSSTSHDRTTVKLGQLDDKISGNVCAGIEFESSNIGIKVCQIQTFRSQHSRL